MSFVGSTPIAKSIFNTANKAGKRVQALGGAKNHMVVMPDASVEQAADAAISAGYGSAGERCMAISVLVCVGDTADRIIPEIQSRTASLNVGPGLSEDPMDMGPLITAEHRSRVASYVDTGVAEGADLVIDGRDLTVDGHPDGYWLGPCLFDNVTPNMSIYRDEIFGPVLSIVRVDNYNDAMALVNSHEFGNGAAIFTNDGRTARRFELDVQAGMVGINIPIPVPVTVHSFGGWKNSLFGDTHIYGPEGIKFYTRYKAVTTRWPGSDEKRRLDLGFPS